MGSGSYSQIVFGILDLEEHHLEEAQDFLEELLSDCGVGVTTAYEAATKHLGISIASTLHGSDAYLSIGSCRLEELGERVRQCAERTGRYRFNQETRTSELVGELTLTRAKRAWAEFQTKTKAVGFTIPDGELFWVDDYD